MKMKRSKNILPDEKTTLRHPSFGIVNLVRTTTRGRTLFGSSILHDTYVTLTISHAQIDRDLSQDWIMEDVSLPHSTIVEVDMSATQFAEMITSFSQGGTPCTITF